MGGGIPGQFPLRGGRYQLPVGATTPLAVAELLVPGRRGAILRRVPDALPAGGEGTGLAITAGPSGDLPRRRHRRLVLLVDRSDGVAPGPGVLFPADPGVGARPRSTGGGQ